MKLEECCYFDSNGGGVMAVADVARERIARIVRAARSAGTRSVTS